MQWNGYLQHCAVPTQALSMVIKSPTHLPSTPWHAIWLFSHFWLHDSATSAAKTTATNTDFIAPLP